MLAPFKMADGSVAAPGLGFNNETTTGLYRPSAGVFGFSVLGVNALTLDATQALFGKIPRFASAPVGSTDLANKAYVDSAAGGAAAAGSLTGTTLAANVVNSSLQTVGNLTNLTVTGSINAPGGITGVVEAWSADVDLKLLVSSPFTHTLSVSVVAATKTGVTVEVFDSLGRRVAVPGPHREIGAGESFFRWLPGDAPSGVYFVRAVADGGVRRVRRAVLVR